MKLFAATGLAVAILATPASADHCNKYVCRHVAPVGTPYPVGTPGPVGVPGLVGTPGFGHRPGVIVQGRSFSYERRTRIIVREHWKVRCNNRTGECRRIY